MVSVGYMKTAPFLISAIILGLCTMNSFLDKMRMAEQEKKENKKLCRLGSPKDLYIR